MPPKKEKASTQKKAAQKKAQSFVDDKTFGLKNKNKSSKVQKYVQQVNKMASSMTGQKYQSKEQKEREARLKKEAKQREEEELALLFGHMSGGAAKTKAKMEALEEEKRKAKEREREAAGNANVWIEQDMTGKPIEVVIEYEREKLAFHHRVNNTQGTAVTPESFAKWKTDRAEAKRLENEQKVQKEMTKKGKKAALSVLSGKDLFTYDATLFVDDEGAIDDNDENMDLKNIKGLMEEEEEQEEGDEPGETNLVKKEDEEEDSSDGGETKEKDKFTGGSTTSSSANINRKSSKDQVTDNLEKLQINEDLFTGEEEEDLDDL